MGWRVEIEHAGRVVKDDAARLRKADVREEGHEEDARLEQAEPSASFDGSSAGRSWGGGPSRICNFGRVKRNKVCNLQCVELLDGFLSRCPDRPNTFHVRSYGVAYLGRDTGRMETQLQLCGMGLGET